ncbi:hypothetical protein GYA19_00695 [Candidatus Beckwithbacteria bacterium]|nr:hypothetical protein [Candidatus Beckwithbacteria bacterium]
MNLKQKITHFLPLPYLTFILLWFFLCLFSFSQKDLNLTIYDYPVVRDVINKIIEFGYFQRAYNTILFTILTLVFCGNYLYLIFQQKLLQLKYLIRVFIILLIIGIPAYPAFSHDIFNYLFNAKMLVIYHVDPHIHTALEFPNDLWLRFMHNIHTTAPYGYIFTYLSIIPFILGFGNFTLTFWLFKLFIIAFLALESFLLFKLALMQNKAKAVQILSFFILNPLILFETVITGHNDSVMMGFALLSIYFLSLNLQSFLKYSLSLVSFLVSIYIKYATLVLTPIWFWCKKFKWDFYFWGGLALLAVLLTRIGQLHSWYLQWGFVLLILAKSKLSKLFAILLTLGGLIRYAPFVYYGNWDSPVPTQRYILLLLPLAAVFFPKIRDFFSKKIN